MPTTESKTEVGSYFISNYPPYSQWSTDHLDAVAAAMASPPAADTPLGLYLHIPFCRKRCKFCYFKVFTDVNAAEVQRYVDALCNEISMVSQQAAMGWTTVSVRLLWRWHPQLPFTQTTHHAGRPVARAHHVGRRRGGHL